MTSNAALLFAIRHNARLLANRGVNLAESTRGIKVDDQVVALLSEHLDLPSPFMAEVFRGGSGERG